MLRRCYSGKSIYATRSTVPIMPSFIAEALLNEKDLHFKKHGSVHGSFSQHYVKTGIFDAKFHKLLTKSFGQRILGDYDEVTRFSSDEVSAILEQAWEFLEVAKKYLASQI